MKRILILLIITALLTILFYLINYKKPNIAGASDIKTNIIMGLVVPHHDLARELVLNTLKNIIAAQNEFTDYQTIAVLSPNHYRPQSETFTSTKILKDFPIDTETLDKIREAEPQILFDETLLDKEHGLYIPMGYLRLYFPKASFIPIAISRYYTPEKLRQMANILTELLPKNALIVASTDFSHEHTISEAKVYDAQTIQAIYNKDYQKLYKFGDDNLDSPAAMGILMQVMEKRSAGNFELLEESHGGILTGNPSLVGTSYVIGSFKSKIGK